MGPSGGNPRLPLAGLKVLELGRMLAAPLVGQLLGDLGAEVLKVERRGEGDIFRMYGPPFVTDGDGQRTPDSAIYTSANRNKSSIEVDLATAEGQALVRDLARVADIFVENFKVGSLAQFGLDEPSLRQANPGVIYLSLSGFGQTGPYARRPGTDSAFQAMSGLMDVSGEADGEPTKVGTYAIDYTAGLYGALSVLAALRHRDQTGEGQHIDLSILECALAFMAPRAADFLIGQSVPKRIGNRTPGSAPGQLFRCSDGYLLVQAGADRLFAALCRAMGREDLLADPRFATLPLRVANVDALAEALEATFVSRTSHEWYEALSAAGLVTAPVYDIAQCYADPQVCAREVRVSVPHPAGVEIDLVRSPMRFSATPLGRYEPPPRLGEGAEAALSDWLGLAEADIARLREAGAI
jgi:crotonobetainyl-CoA:carnitine CoA-transferase CaiB-like acyl-CoA transferase